MKIPSPDGAMKRIGRWGRSFTDNSATDENSPWDMVDRALEQIP